MPSLKDFSRLLDEAIACAATLAHEATGSDQAWLAEDANSAMKQFRRIKAEALSGALPPSGGAGLGITRALSEWAPDDLYAAGKAVEYFYRRNRGEDRNTGPGNVARKGRTVRR